MTPLREFEQYTILGEIAEGGMGVVYQAVHCGLNRSCALKLIRAGLLATADERRRFVTEAEAAAKLDHPNIVRVGRAAEFEGQWFLEMELVEGGTLADRIAERPLPPKEAAQLVERLAHAVQHAHERGILHRDLKPANVLLAPDDQPKLTDFGLARFLEKDSDLTRTIAVLGTPAYLAPELASGCVREATIKADIYSLGVILFECLTGQRPFQGQTTLEILRAVQDTPTPRPSSLRRDLPRDIETICLKSLEKESNQRYASAEAFADDLERWRTGKPISARSTTAWERTVKWVKREPWKAALAITLFIAVLAPLATAYVYQFYYLPRHSRTNPLMTPANNRVFYLPLDSWGEGRVTVNFSAEYFDCPAGGRCALLEFRNVPTNMLPTLACRVIADIAGRPDDVLTGIVHPGETVFVPKSKWRYRGYYIGSVGWTCKDLLARAPEALVTFTLLPPDWKPDSPIPHTSGRTNLSL